MVEYRPLGEAHREAYFEYTRYAFRPDAGPGEYDPDDHETERMQMGDRRGLFPDDAGPDARPLTVCSHYWFDAVVRGERHPTPGLSAVATPPEHRRAGYVEALLEHSLEEYRDRGDRFSLLWPFRHRFYHNYGWATCSAHRSYSCEPAALSFARETPVEGQYRSLDADDYEVVSAVYEEFCTRYALAIGRDEDWWRHRVFSTWMGDPYVSAWVVDGDVRGYVSYLFEGESRDRTMRVVDWAFLDHEALRALCAYCANHDSQVSEVTFTLPTDVALLDVVPDPEDFDCELETGAMARIVDVADVLRSVQYPDVEAALTLAVDDTLGGWNDRTFRLAVEDETGSCEPVNPDAAPDVTLDIGSLTQLVTGYRSASQLERTGRLDGSTDVVSTLERLFPPDQTYLGTGF